MTTAPTPATLPLGDSLDESQGLRTEDMVVNIGPQHPSTHGVLRLVTRLNGEVVKDMEPVIGYLHRSKEKMAEGRSYFQYQPTIDRIEYLSSFYDHYLYVRGIECIAGLQVTKRAEYIRVVTMELNRITSHLLWFGTFLLDLGATSPLFYAFREREDIFTLFEELTGARMMYNYYRFGGANNDMPDGWLDQVRQVINNLPKIFDEYEAIVTKNPIVMDRTVGQGIMDKALCLKYGVTGPSLRAAGIPQDLRITNPYCSYEDFSFDVPMGKNGDVYDRYLIRIAEMRESVKIVHQALDNMPGGDTREVKAAQAKYDAAKAAAKESGGSEPEAVPVDWLIRPPKQKVNLLTYKPPAGEATVYVESPRGMLGIHMVSDGTPKPARVKWRGASFSNLAALPELMINHMIPDLMAIFGSLDVILPEVDR